MARTKISEFSATPANNTDIDSINIAEGCAPSGINDAIRELMAQLKDFQTGAVGDSFNGPIGTSTAAAGAFTTLAASGAVTLSGGTANGVTYLNGSKVLSSSATLTWNNSTQQLGFQNAAATGYAYIGTAGAGSNTDLAFYMGASEGMRLTSTGLGIGTSSPVGRIDSYGDGTNPAGVFRRGGAYGNIESSDAGRTNRWSIGRDNASTGNFVIAYNDSTKTSIDTSGRFGLGVTPTGSWNFQVTSSSGASRIRLQNSSTGSADADGGGIQMEGTTLVLQNSENGPCTFEINGSERARISAGGSFFVGATSGAGKFVSSNTNNASGDFNIVGLLGANCNNTSSYHLLIATGGADKLYIYGNGNIVNVNNSYGSLSDVKLKENIVDTSPKLADLLQVKVRNYNLIGDTTKQLGVVAQELEAVFPAMIDVSPDRDAEGNDLGTTTKSVKYSVFVPMLIKAIQEQQAIIESLKARLDAANL